VLFRAEPLVILGSAVELGIVFQPLFKQPQVISTRVVVYVAPMRCLLKHEHGNLYIHQVETCLLYFSNSSLRTIHFSHCAGDSKTSFIYDTQALYLTL
jgi:hypothetical protein